MLEKLHYAKSRFSVVLNDVLRYNTYRATSHVQQRDLFFCSTIPKLLLICTYKKIHQYLKYILFTQKVGLGVVLKGVSWYNG